MGGFYTYDEYLDFEYLYCEECGDSDQLIGSAETRVEAWNLLKDEVDLFDPALCVGCTHNGDFDYCDNECENGMGSGGYSRSYVEDFIAANWDE